MNYIDKCLARQVEYQKKHPIPFWLPVSTHNFYERLTISTATKYLLGFTDCVSEREKRCSLVIGELISEWYNNQGAD